MASRGKRKQPSSSSSTDYDTTRFVSKAAEELYLSFVNDDKLIICEIQFRPLPRDGDILRQLNALKWGKLAVQEGPANFTIVREFYANLIRSTSRDSITVRAKPIRYSVDAINRFYGLPDVDPCAYHQMITDGPDYDMILQELGPPGATWNYSSAHPSVPLNLAIAQCLNRYANAWCKFLRHTLCPTSQKSYLTKDRVVLLYCILKGLPINAGRVIYASLLQSAKDKSHNALCHPVLITQLCAKAKVPHLKGDALISQMCVDSCDIQKIGQLPNSSPRSDGFGFRFNDLYDPLPPQPVPLPRLRRLSALDNMIVDARLAERASNRIRRGHVTDPSSAAASPSPNAPSSSSTPLPRDYTNADIGRMFEALTVSQQETAQRVRDSQYRDLLRDQYTTEYMTAYNHHHGFSQSSDPPFPSFPAQLLQPYLPQPANPEDDVEWPAWQQSQPRTNPYPPWE